MGRAEWALHERTRLAGGAAMDAGVAGRFRVWEHAGLMAVLVTDPALDFLSTVSGVLQTTVPSAIELVDMPVWNGVRPTVVVSTDLGEASEALLSAGFVRSADRGLAIRQLHGSPVDPAASEHLEVVDADSVDFLHVLLAGYEVGGVVAAFIEAEHRLPAVRSFLALERDVPIAAAAMTIHGDVAVLGGTSTLRPHRGKGAQPRLLQHRLRTAIDAGCRLAVATVVPDSVSAANLRRAGFSLHRRSAWRKP